MKHCTKCKEMKPLADFSFETRRAKHRPDCKACNNRAANLRHWGASEEIIGRKRINRTKYASTLNGWFAKKLIGVRRNAAERRLVMDLTPQTLVDLYNRQDGKCAVTGIELLRVNVASPYSLSVDRVDDTQGYIPNNVRLVCWWYNCARMKGMTDGDVKIMCQLVMEAQ